MKYKIIFNRPASTGHEEQYVLQAMRSGQISGDCCFGHKCQTWFEEKLDCAKVLLTPSCTAALEMAAILLDIQPGDEVIMPSYTFVSTANAFVLRGAIIVFVDIRPDTMNIDETLIEAAITSKTRLIVPVHYAGVACEMDVIMEIANRRNLYVVEDAAQGVMSSYNGAPLGTIGHFGTYSFHETKNITSGGEGGLLIINDDKFVNRAEIIREKGTNRSQFFRGAVDKYSWVDVGSSYLMNDLSAAYLWGNIEMLGEITQDRLSTWHYYYDSLTNLETRGCIELPTIQIHNGHMFYIKVKSLNIRDALIGYLKEKSILAAFHYVPLHSSVAGKRLGVFHGVDSHTTTESERLLRLPMHYKMTVDDLDYVVESIQRFFNVGTIEDSRA
jgi:dTDP-4-amino-4,6-dideoxygalactose transaminase